MFKVKGKDRYQCSILCEMTDFDTILKLQKELGVGRVSKRVPRPPRKDSWLLAIQKQQDIFDTLLHIMPHLGERRLKKARQIFDYLEPIICK